MKVRLDGLRLQLLGVVLIPFTFLLMALAFAGVNFHGQAMRRLVAERDERSVRAAAAALSEKLHHRRAAVQGLALRLADGSSPARVLHGSEFLQSDFDGGLAIAGPEGRILAGSLQGEIATSEPLLGLLLSSSDSEVELASFFGESATFVLVTARAGDDFVIGASTIANLLTPSLLSPSQMGPGYRAFLVDTSGETLLTLGEPIAPDEVPEHPGVVAAFRGETGASYVPGSGGERVVTYSSIHPTGWALVVEESWQDVGSPILDLSMAAPLALVPALVLTSIGLLFGARQVIEPLRRLQRRASALSAGDARAIEEPVGGIAEIRELQASLAAMARRVQAAQQTLRGYLGEMTTAQEEERSRLARELHDETIQDLIALDHKIQILSMRMKREMRAEAEELDGLHQSVQQSIQEVRRLSRGLRPIYLEDLGLVPALEMLARDAQLVSGLPVGFDVEGTAVRLPSDAELAVYRIVQEALANASRHADAGRVLVHLAFGEGELRIDVEDDGSGFRLPDDLGELAGQGHYGLIGMMERAQFMGARLSLESAPGQGACVRLILPYPEHLFARSPTRQKA